MRELEEGRPCEREEIAAAEAKPRVFEENEPYKGELDDTAEEEISLYTQGEFTDLCRGPHVRTRADQGGQAHLARRRVLARRREQQAADPPLRHRVLPRPTGRVPGAARGGEGARPPQARPRLDLFDLSEESLRPADWLPKGDGDLESLNFCAGSRTRSAATCTSIPRRSTNGLWSRAATGRSSGTACSRSRARARSRRCA